MEFQGFLDEDPPPHHQFQPPPGMCWCRGVCNINEFMALLRSSIREEVEEVVKRVILPHLPSVQTSPPPSTSRSSPNDADSSASKTLQLHFVGTLPDTLLTLNTIQDEGASLIVELRDESGSRVEIGSESSAKIELVVLDGDFDVDDRDDWTEEEFQKNVARPREGRPALLKVKCKIALNKGVASISDISFTDNSKSMRNGQFRLGARVVGNLPPGVVVRGAVSTAFRVKERRVKSYGKHRTPLLENEIWCLNHIGKNGPNCQRLLEEEIRKVQDFLQLYHTDEKKLREILHIPEKKWQEIVKIAKSCPLINEYYSYYDDATGIELLLDCVFNIVSITFGGQINKPYGTLDVSEKELVHNLRCIAYQKRNELPRTYSPTNQMTIHAAPICPPSIQHTNMPYVDVQAIDQGEPTKQANSCSSGPMQYPFGHEDEYQQEAPISQMLDLDPDHWDHVDLWNLGRLTPLLEEAGNMFEAPMNAHVTSKLKAACYVTKAAMMFMISIQQDPSAPNKRQKLQ